MITKNPFPELLSGPIEQDYKPAPSPSKKVRDRLGHISLNEQDVVYISSEKSGSKTLESAPTVERFLWEASPKPENVEMKGQDVAMTDVDIASKFRPAPIEHIESAQAGAERFVEYMIPLKPPVPFTFDVHYRFLNPLANGGQFPKRSADILRQSHPLPHESRLFKTSP